MSCPHVYDVAPYALGTLDPAERADVAAHLPACPQCQAVLESIAGLPGLLARVGPDAVEPEADAVDEAMFERLVARARPVAPLPNEPEEYGRPTRATRARPRRARSGWPWRWVAAAAAAIVVGVGAGGWVVEHRDQDPVRVVAASAGAVHARVWLRSTPAGTAVRLELGGVPPEQHCSLVAVDRAGRRTVAATWEATYSGTATFDGSVPVPVDRLVSLRVETDHATLLTMPVS